MLSPRAVDELDAGAARCVNQFLSLAVAVPLALRMGAVIIVSWIPGSLILRITRPSCRRPDVRLRMRLICPVADFAPELARLHEFQMMRIARRASTHQNRAGDRIGDCFRIA